VCQQICTLSMCVRACVCVGGEGGEQALQAGMCGSREQETSCAGCFGFSRATKVVLLCIIPGAGHCCHLAAVLCLVTRTLLQSNC